HVGGELLPERQVEPEARSDLVDAIGRTVLSADLHGGIGREHEEDDVREQRHEEEHDDHAAEPVEHHADHARTSPASAIPRTRSPSVVNDMTSRKRKTPGMMKYIGSTAYHGAAEAIICPQLGVGGTTPTPRNERPASVPT